MGPYGKLRDCLMDVLLTHIYSRRRVRDAGCKLVGISSIPGRRRIALNRASQHPALPYPIIFGVQPSTTDGLDARTHYLSKFSSVEGGNLVRIPVPPEQRLS